jgi:hypothetical protein
MKIKLGITWCLLLVLINHKSSKLFASAKSLETQHCAEHVGSFFTTSLNVTIQSSGKVGECRCVMIFIGLGSVVISDKSVIFSALLPFIAPAIHQMNLHIDVLLGEMSIASCDRVKGNRL